VELLLGMGLRRFSVAPGEILPVKDAIRRADLDHAEALARQALQLSTHQEVDALLGQGPTRDTSRDSPISTSS
jgi:phosphoenolpyruvate-protein kinase (PTS system EI component)